VAKPVRKRQYSILAQPLDRAAFIAYFLGAIVPLAALGWVIRRWVHPERLSDGARWAVLGLLLSIAVLSFASFLVLRRTAHMAIQRLDRENRRLSHLLEASGALAASADDDEILRFAATSAVEVAESAGGYVVGPVRSGAFEILASHPEPPPAEATRAVIVSAAESASETLKMALRGAELGGNGALAVAVPFNAGRQGGGALVVTHPATHTVEEGERRALSTLSSLARVSLRNADLHEAERNFFTHATNLLVATLDRYLDDRADHSRRVASLANRVARTLSLPETRLERLHFASLLHDIGMLRVPRQHMLDLEEVRRHPELGDEMLRPIRIWEDLAPFVRHHHEWWDGRGYPDHLGGEEIPLESRIIGAAEAFDAMTSERSYQKSVPLVEAIERLRAGAGTQFDPGVVQAFVELYHDGALS